MKYPGLVVSTDTKIKIRQNEHLPNIDVGHICSILKFHGFTSRWFPASNTRTTPPAASFPTISAPPDLAEDAGSTPSKPNLRFTLSYFNILQTLQPKYKRKGIYFIFKK